MVVKWISSVVLVVINLINLGFCDVKTIDLKMWRNEYNYPFFDVKENYTGDLDIQFNPETVYDADEFRLGEAQLSSFPENIFQVVRGVRTIEIRNAGMQRLRQSDFIGGTDLTKLDIIDNLIRELPADVFVHLKSLKSLRLSGNPIATLDANLFVGLVNLEDLSLNDMKLTSIPTDLFKPLPNLDFVSLSSNNIPEIQDGVFSHNLKLQHICLDRCSTKYIHPNVFANLDLRTLEIQANSYESPIYAPKAKYLIAHHSDIRELHLNGPVNDIQLENNKLERFESRDMSEIWRLDLKGNQISDVSFLTNMGGLVRLDLSGNPVRQGLTKEFFDDKPKLRMLYMANMNLTELPVGLFDGSKELWDMSLAHNKLTHLDIDLFKNLKGLESVDLEGNPLVNFDVDGLKEVGFKARLRGTIDDKYRQCRYVIQTSRKVDRNELEECKNLLKYYIDNDKLHLL